MEVRDPASGEEFTLYFDVSIKMEAMSKALSDD